MRSVGLVCLLAAAPLAVSAQAGRVGLPDTAPPGASSCSGCHGGALRDGQTLAPIHGRPAGEIADAMAAFRSGERPATVMTRIAKGFSPEESRAIAEWLEVQRP